MNMMLRMLPKNGFEVGGGGISAMLNPQTQIKKYILLAN